MDEFKIIKQGAEARLYEGTYLGRPAIVKERFVKKYRHPKLDELLTKERIKAETRALVKCKLAGIPTPMILSVDFNRRRIFMEHFINSIVLKDFIENAPTNLLTEVSLLIGNSLGKLHEANIIHGDLTSSNMLLVNKNNLQNFNLLSDLKLIIIDFGLAHVDPSSEDKGVDIYVLERALCSTHRVAMEMFPKIMEGYKQYNKKGWKEVLAKYEEVRARGRKRTMIG